MKRLSICGYPANLSAGRTGRALALALALFAISHAIAANYYWTGNAESDNNWSTVDNWGNPCESTDDGAFEFTKADSTTIYLKTATAKPGTADNAYFEQAATITLTTSENINYTYFNADVTLTSSSSQYLNLTQDTAGTGKLTLDGYVYLRAASKGISISNPLEIASSNVSIRPNSNYIVTIEGKLTGSGTLTCTQQDKNSYGSVRFKGDTSDFRGTVRFTMSYQTNNASNISDAKAADNTNSSWEIYPDSDYVPTSDNQGYFPFRIDGGTFKFGYLYANVPKLATAADCKNITLEIGAKNQGSYLGGDFASSTGATVKWIGDDTSIFTNNCAGVAALQVTNGGKVYFPSSAGVPTALTFSNGGKAIAASKAIYEAVSALVTGQENVTVIYGGEVNISVSDNVSSISVLDGCTINYTHDYTIAKDLQLFTLASENADKVTIKILSPNTKAESKFFKAKASGNNILADYKDGIYYWDDATSYTSKATGWTLVGDSAIAALGYSGCVLVFPYVSGENVETLEIAKDKEAMGSVYFGRDVKFTPSSGSNQKRVLLQTSSSDTIAEGPGKIILKDGVKLMAASSNAKVYNNIELDGDTTTVWSAQNDKTLYVYGNLTGTADMELDTNGTGNKKGSVHFYGKTSSYTGTLTTKFGVDGSSLQFYAGTDGIYVFGGTLVLGETGNTSALCATAGTYTFGSLSGKVKGGAEDVTLKVGASSTSIAYTKASNNGVWKLVHTGAGNITQTGDRFDEYEVKTKGAKIILSGETDANAVTVAEGNEATYAESSGVEIMVGLSPEEKLEAKQIVVPAGNATSASSTTLGRAYRYEDWTLTSPWALTGAGGFVMTTNNVGENITLTLDEGGILVLNPPRVPVKLSKAPVFSGGKLALANEYKHNTLGKFTLMTWFDGSSPTLPEGAELADIFTNTTSAASYTLETVDASAWAGENAKQLVLTLGDYATSPRKTFTILPMGDSITEGVRGGSLDTTVYPNYRIPLMNKLTAAGYAVSTVGWRSVNQDDAAGVAAPIAWRNHSGKEGEHLIWPTTQSKVRGAIRESLEAMLDQAGDPDVMLLMIGTNDLIQDSTGADKYIVSLTNVIWRTIHYRPRTKIVVSTLLDLGSDTYRELGIAYNEAIRGLFAENNTYGFPTNTVFLADNDTYVPRKVDNVYANMFLKSDNVHPNWIGHDKFSDGWFDAVTNAVSTADLAGSVTTNTTSGGANNVPEAYRSGFKRAAVISIAQKGSYAYNTPITYTGGEEDAATVDIERVGYYLELKRTGSEHRRWVWVDMNAGYLPLAELGMPVAETRQEIVSNLHICSNDPAIHTVAANDDTVEGFIEFTPFSTTGAASDIEGAPASIQGAHDWNDTINGSSQRGAMQVFRIFKNGEYFDDPAEVLFAYNGWCSSTQNKYYREIGIGNFAQHVSGNSIDYTNTNGSDTMGTAAYEVMRLEIWTKAAEPTSIPDGAHVWTGAASDGKWTTPGNWARQNKPDADSHYPGYSGSYTDDTHVGVAVFTNVDATVAVEIDADMTIADLLLMRGRSGAENNVSLTGSHTLTITNANCYPCLYRNLTLDGAHVTVSGKYIGVANRESAKGDASGHGTLTIQNGSTVSAKGLYVCGKDSLVVIDGGDVTISNDVQANAGGRLIVRSGTLTANSLTRTKGSSASDIRIEGGTANIKNLQLNGGGALDIISGTVNITGAITYSEGNTITLAENASITLPSDAAADELVSHATLQMNPRTITMQNESEDATVTSYYTLKRGEDNHLHATIDADQVMNLTPSEANPTPFTMDASAATFSIANVKRGFYYSIKSSTSPDASYAYSDAAGATQQATADGTLSLTLPFDFSSSNVKYFKIAVGDEAPTTP